MINRTQKFWNEQADWSRATFGSDIERGPLGPLKHLEKEARESISEAERVEKFKSFDEKDSTEFSQMNLKACIADLKMEISDCLFLTFDAARRAGMTLDELLDTAFHKLEINKSRVWGKPTVDGPVEHIRG